MDIVFLDEMPEAIATLAPAFWAEWGRHDGLSLEQVASRFEGCLQRDRLPLVLLAHDGAELLGTVGLHDRPVVGRDGLGPWLVALWVKPEHRGRGIGGRLIAAAEAAAVAVGLSDLYAATGTAVQLFRRAGWHEVDRFDHRGEALSLFHWHRTSETS